jgi:hypothetical protein
LREREREREGGREGGVRRNIFGNGFKIKLSMTLRNFCHSVVE